MKPWIKSVRIYRVVCEPLHGGENASKGYPNINLKGGKWWAQSYKSFRYKIYLKVTCSSFHVASIVFLIALTYVFCKPASPLDVVDTCLFTCDYCFKGEVLLKCANECLEQGGEISQTWLKTCPYFGQPLYFD
ncbi:unnamed protein product [Timema podura]|uniref:Uncharacterized protein n=1 Tax=Timema podura TaxID=61482 RepID=A0ABN7P4W9_TIMPD|nr:unnamed protein product [Timema podura]